MTDHKYTDEEILLTAEKCHKIGTTCDGCPAEGAPALCARVDDLVLEVALKQHKENKILAGANAFLQDALETKLRESQEKDESEAGYIVPGLIFACETLFFIYAYHLKGIDWVLAAAGTLGVVSLIFLCKGFAGLHAIIKRMRRNVKKKRSERRKAIIREIIEEIEEEKNANIQETKDT